MSLSPEPLRAQINPPEGPGLPPANPLPDVPRGPQLPPANPFPFDIPKLPAAPLPDMNPGKSLWDVPPVSTGNRINPVVLFVSDKGDKPSIYDKDPGGKEAEQHDRDFKEGGGKAQMQQEFDDYQEGKAAINEGRWVGEGGI